MPVADSEAIGSSVFSYRAHAARTDLFTATRRTSAAKGCQRLDDDGCTRKNTDRTVAFIRVYLWRSTLCRLSAVVRGYLRPSAASICGSSLNRSHSTQSGFTVAPALTSSRATAWNRSRSRAGATDHPYSAQPSGVFS